MVDVYRRKNKSGKYLRIFYGTRRMPAHPVFFTSTIWSSSINLGDPLLLAVCTSIYALAINTDPKKTVKELFKP